MSKPKNDLTIKQKIELLDNLLEWFGGEDFEIELALEKYQKAKQLAVEISNDLETKRNQIIEL